MHHRPFMAAVGVLALFACSNGSGGGGGGGGGGIVLPPGSSLSAHPRMSFFGGGLYERAQGITATHNGNIYIAGHSSSDLATVFGTGQAGYASQRAGGPDAYVAILSSDLTQVLAWTFFGGSVEDRAYSVVVDSSDRVWIEGFTDSADLPTTDGSASHGGREIFIARFSPDLQQLQFATLIGGSHDDHPRGSFFVDALGNSYVGGSTASHDFPTTPGAFQVHHAGGLPVDDLDAFVIKVSPTGQILWSTFLGGSGNDSTFSGVQVFSDGSVYVAGMTNSADFPTTPGAYQKTYGGDLGAAPHLGDAFVARLSPNGDHLIFSTFLGGSGDDGGAANDGLELDALGRAILAGQTSSKDFPTTSGAFRRWIHESGDDGFVSKLSADGSDLLASTYFGGSDFEEPSGVAVDPYGNIYVSGTTASADFPVTPDGDDRVFGGGPGDVMLCKFAPDLKHLIHSTYIGGSGASGFGDRGRALALDDRGAIVLGGDTDSPDLDVPPNALLPNYQGGNADALIATVRLDRSYVFGTGKPTSIGTIPSMGWDGAPSASGPGFVIEITDGVPGEVGMLAESQAPEFQAFPFGNWYLSRPITLLPPVTFDSQGKAKYTLPVSSGMVGLTRAYQFRFSDPNSPDGTGIGLSNALKVTYVP
jgi:beta-propeller repeat-containing protein